MEKIVIFLEKIFLCVFSWNIFFLPIYKPRGQNSFSCKKSHSGYFLFWSWGELIYWFIIVGSFSSIRRRRTLWDAPDSQKRSPTQLLSSLQTLHRTSPENMCMWTEEGMLHALVDEEHRKYMCCGDPADWEPMEYGAGCLWWWRNAGCTHVLIDILDPIQWHSRGAQSTSQH